MTAASPVDILLVCPQPSIRAGIKALLANPCYRYTEVWSAAEAQAALQERRFAVVLVEAAASGLNGPQLAAEMAGEQDDRRQVLTVVIVDHFPGKLAEDVADGVEYLVRPFPEAVLRAKVATYASLHRRGEMLTRRTLELQQSEARLKAAVRLRTAALAKKNRELKRQVGEYRKLNQLLERTSCQLSESEARTRAVLDSAGAGIIVVDREGLVKEFNQTAEDLFGYFAAEVVGRKLTTFLSASGERAALPPAAGPGQPESRDDLLSLGTREIEARRKDGTGFAVEWSVSEVEGVADVALIGIVRDITERRQTQEQLLQAQKMEAVGRLTGSVAHDFNNLLTVIVGSLQLLAEETQESRAEHRELIEDALAAARDSADLTHRLLAFSRQGGSNRYVVDVNELIGDFSRLLNRTLGPAVKLRVVRGEERLPVRLDAKMLQHSLLNLALNARDAMPNGGVLSLETASVDHLPHVGTPAGGPAVVITVTDTGSGMPEDVLRQATLPFFTTKALGKGSGLGLSMVSGFVERCGGRLDIASEMGRGTAVSLYLPYTDEAAAIEKRDAEGVLPRGTEHILMVEDDDGVRRFGRRVLKRLGYRVETVEDVRAALPLLRSGQPPQLLFTDISLPGGVRGDELAAAVLRARPAIKVLLATGYDEREEQPRSEGLAVLRKPYDARQLALRVREVLDADAARPLVAPSQAGR